MTDHSQSNAPFDDVRMRGFTRRTTVAAAVQWLDEHCSRIESEVVPLSKAAFRVLAEEVISTRDVPAFDRSMMDGFAVRGEDTLGASPYNQLPLEIVGQILAGQQLDLGIKAGQAIRIMTGAPIPAGADAVIPAEKVEVRGSTLVVSDEVPPAKNVGRRGEDIPHGTKVLSAGRILRPQDLGVLASIARDSISVVRRPRVQLVITGNELVAAGNTPSQYQIMDANGPMLKALVQRDGGEPSSPELVPDIPDEILQAMGADVDVVILSGGSSVGQEDHAPSLLARHGQLAIHGIAMRPSSPTGMGFLGRKLVFLLPGNPVSCLCGYDFFAGRAIRLLGGRSPDWPYPQVSLPLARKLVSTIGRCDYARVRIHDGQIEPLSIAGASVLSSTTRADGFVIIPQDLEGYAAGTIVTVYRYDNIV